MRSLNLIVFSALSALDRGTFANFLDDEPNPCTTFTSFPPCKPTPVPEPNEHLQPGQRYADPHANPFNKLDAWIYGPIEGVAENFTFPDGIHRDQQKVWDLETEFRLALISPTHPFAHLRFLFFMNF